MIIMINIYEYIIIGSGGLPVINIDSEFNCSTDNHIFKADGKNILNIYIQYII